MYAAGLTLRELLAGDSPFRGLSQVQIMHRMVAGTVPDLPEITDLSDPDALRRVHAESLARSPRERFATAGAMADALARVAERLGGLPSTTKMATFLATIDPELGPRVQARVEA